MSGQLGSAIRLAPLVQWMAARGLTGADLEVKGDLLVVEVPPESRRRLLTEAALREQLVVQGEALGFSRVALELSTGA